MSNLTNMLPQQGNGSKTETNTVEQPSQSLPTGDAAAAANKDENAPSTSQGQQQPQQHQQPEAPEAASTSHKSSNRSAAKSGTATPMTQLNGPVMRIKRELNEIMQNPPPNCSAEMYKEDLFHWKATILGPSGTVYEGGIFKLDIRFPGAYPFRPPQIRFITRIYHCNVDSRGVICLDVINERWSPVMNIAKVLLSIWVLIGECNPNDPLVMGIADQYKSNRREHDKVARYWTTRFAMPKTKPTSKFEQELMQCQKSKQEQDHEQAPDGDQVSEQSQEQPPDQELEACHSELEKLQLDRDQTESPHGSETSSSITVTVNHSRSQT